MRRTTTILRALVMASLLGLYGCQAFESLQPLPPIPFEPSAKDISYVEDVKPVLDRTCIACHACYDAPCQLKLTAAEGVTRGASKDVVYTSARLLNASPTRLFIDAQTTAQWREKGFFAVTGDSADNPGRSIDNLNTSLISQMIALGREQPLAPHSRVPEDIQLGLQRENQCPKLSEFDRYANEKPLQGMPLAMTGLADKDYQVLQNWIWQGAVIDEPPWAPTADEQARIDRWETFLNQTSLKARLSARYLYEHLFLADLYFDDLDALTFYRIVRSSSPPGTPIDIIATTRPNDDPGVKFYYRLRRKAGTVVHKTHTVYALNHARLQRFKQLFLDTDWDVTQLPDYSSDNAANPFTTFAAIPARSRYQFLLDEAQYIVRTFIRGPVCRGQIATNVINDHFYVLFQDPEHDLSVTDADYLRNVSSDLAVSGEGWDILPIGVDEISHKLKRNEYIRLRGQAYRKYQPQGPALSSIWGGDGHNRDAMLTVFRHFDNTTVVQGFVGALPKTLWVMDYPLLERTYYSLVVNFNVFGGVAHQVATRMYFDLIRTGAENNFLHFMPPGVRTDMRKSWNRGTAIELKSALAYEVVNEDLPVQIGYRTDQPKAEFVDRVNEQLSAIARHDSLNRCAKPPCIQPGSDAAQQQADTAIETLTSKPASNAGMNFIRYMPDVLFLRVSTGKPENDLAYTLVRNKAHSNVGFMIDESDRRERGKDTLTAYPDLLGSYPNFMFVIPLSEIEAFASAMHAIQSDAQFLDLVKRYGIERTHPDIWAHFNWFVDYMQRTHPVQAGVYDLNRYKKLSELMSP